MKLAPGLAIIKIFRSVISAEISWWQWRHMNFLEAILWRVVVPCLMDSVGGLTTKMATFLAKVI